MAGWLSATHHLQPASNCPRQSRLDHTEPYGGAPDILRSTRRNGYFPDDRRGNAALIDEITHEDVCTNCPHKPQLIATDEGDMVCIECGLVHRERLPALGGEIYTCLIHSPRVVYDRGAYMVERLRQQDGPPRGVDSADLEVLDACYQMYRRRLGLHEPHSLTKQDIQSLLRLVKSKHRHLLRRPNANLLERWHTIRAFLGHPPDTGGPLMDEWVLTLLRDLGRKMVQAFDVMRHTPECRKGKKHQCARFKCRKNMYHRDTMHQLFLCHLAESFHNPIFLHYAERFPALKTPRKRHAVWRRAVELFQWGNVPFPYRALGELYPTEARAVFPGNYSGPCLQTRPNQHVQASVQGGPLGGHGVRQRGG